MSDNPNVFGQMRAMAALMMRKSHNGMAHGYDPDLGGNVDDGFLGSGGGPQGSLKTPLRQPLPPPTQGGKQ